MKCIKMLGLWAAAAAAVLAFAGIASATITSPAGTVYNGTISASSSNISIDGSVNIACGNSTFQASVNQGNTAVPLKSMTFTECGKDTVSILRMGSFTVDSKGTIIFTSAEITVTTHRTALGFPITIHCIYGGTTFGHRSLTEGVSPGVIHVGSAPIPEVATDSACGNDAVLTGTYTVTTPSSAIVVD